MFTKDDVKSKMQAAVDHLRMEFSSLRTNRVNPHMLDSIKVDAYGSDMMLKALASVSVQDRQLIVSPFDPSLTGAIIKAIQSTNMGLNPIAEKQSIRIPVPPLTEDLRKAIARDAKAKAESAKVTIRDVRRKGMKDQEGLTEDEKKNLEKDIQKLTDQYCDEIDKLFREKEKEILTV